MEDGSTSSSYKKRLEKRKKKDKEMGIGNKQQHRNIT